MTGRGFPFHDEPAALLLTDAVTLSTAVSEFAQTLAAQGFVAYVAPWHAVRIEAGRVLLASGHVVDSTGTRPLSLWSLVRPRLVLPLALPARDGMTTALRRLADCCPDAWLTWAPELASVSGRAGTERLLRRAAIDVPRLRTALLPGERDRLDAAADRPVVVRESVRGGARGAQVLGGGTVAALLDRERHDDELVVTPVPSSDLDIRVFALITGYDPPRAVISPEGYARSWPDGWARQATLPSLDGQLPRAAGIPSPQPDAASAVCDPGLWSAVLGLVASYVTALCAAAGLRDMALRHRTLPWITVDLIVTEEDGRRVPRLLDVELHCEPRAQQGLTAAVAADAVRELADRCRRSESVLLPAPETSIPPGHLAGSSTPADPAAGALLPRIGPEACVVDTIAWPGARFTFCDDSLVAPPGEDLLDLLGRVIGQSPGPVQPRYVEPGVGRTCLIGGVTVGGHPEYQDVSVLGIGLTPFSDHGYAMIGPHVDGRTSLLRAELRRRTERRLAAAGARTSLVGAIIELPGLDTTMPDRTSEPAALVVRAFRSVLRVKQLDPLATPYLSPQHRPLLWDFLTDPRWEPDGRAGQLAAVPGQLGGTVRSQRFIAASHGDPHVSPESSRRREVIAMYAPVLVRRAAEQAAMELGRDPVAEPLRVHEYVEWFARQVGSQLAIMRRERFLHDYHQPGIGTPDPNLTYSLGESNLTLLAEFVDFDTGLFCDQADDLTCDALRLRPADFRRLQDGYQDWHARDVAEARSVVCTLASLAGHGQRDLVRAALRAYDDSYERTAR